MQIETRLSVCQQIDNKKITIKEGAELLGRSYRHMIRIFNKYSEGGVAALIHGNTNKKPHNAIPEEIKKNILNICKERFIKWGPTLISETLKDENIGNFSRETIRLWLRESKIFYKQRRLSKKRKLRPRKISFGEMIQMDGSYHEWFAGKPKYWLMVMVDDATNTIYAQFYDHEGIKPAMSILANWIKQYGIPQSLYCDRKNCYVMPQDVEKKYEQGKLNHFLSACFKNNIRVINANSPQAKGRVERINKTLQDRLVKKLAYNQIDTPDDANVYLREAFLPEYNRSFAKAPQNDWDKHKLLKTNEDVSNLIYLYSERLLRNDWSIFHESVRYEIHYQQSYELRPGKYIQIFQSLDNEICLKFNDKPIRFQKVVE